MQYESNAFYMICHSSFCAILYDANFIYISYIEQNFCESFEREKVFLRVKIKFLPIFMLRAWLWERVYLCDCHEKTFWLFILRTISNHIFDNPFKGIINSYSLDYSLSFNFLQGFLTLPTIRKNRKSFVINSLRKI